MFGKERMENKLNAVSAAFDDANTKRAKTTVTPPASGLVGGKDANVLLALLQTAASGQGQEASGAARADPSAPDVFFLAASLHIMQIHQTTKIPSLWEDFSAR